MPKLSDRCTVCSMGCHLPELFSKQQWCDIMRKITRHSGGRLTGVAVAQAIDRDDAEFIGHT